MFYHGLASLSLANDSNNRVVTGTGSGLNGEANLTFDGSTLDVTGAVTVSGAITGSSTVQGTTITATTPFVPDASDSVHCRYKFIRVFRFIFGRWCCN